MSAIDLPPVIGVILAGGMSRRMFPGSAPGVANDKGLLRLGQDSMLEHVIRRLRPQVRELVLNANGDPARFAPFGLPVVADPIEGYAGPLAGVLAGLQWAHAHAPEATHIVTASSDAPFVPGDLVAKLYAVAASNPLGIVLARSGDGLHPVIGCWPTLHADDLDGELRRGVRKVLHWTDRHGTHAVDFAPISIGDQRVDPFFNANTPDDLTEARRLIALLEARP